MSILDTIKKKVTDYKDTRDVEAEERRYKEMEERYKRADDKLEAKGTYIHKNTSLPADVKAKLVEEAIAKRDKERISTDKKSMIPEPLRKIVSPTKDEIEKARMAKDAQMERKIKTAEQEATLRRLEREGRPSNPPGRPASKAKAGRGEFTAPSYKGGRGYGGGFDIGAFSTGLEPRRGAHPDPFGGLKPMRSSQPARQGPPPSFGDPFAGLGQRPKPKPAPAQKKKQKKSKDVVIRISRNPMIKGLGGIVGIPGSTRRPRGRNPFDF